MLREVAVDRTEAYEGQRKGICCVEGEGNGVVLLGLGFGVGARGFGSTVDLRCGFGFGFGKWVVDITGV